jgi:hypothetical protein
MKRLSPSPLPLDEEEMKAGVWPFRDADINISAVFVSRKIPDKTNSKF